RRRSGCSSPVSHMRASPARSESRSPHSSRVSTLRARSCVICSVTNWKDRVVVMIRKEDWDAAYREQIAGGQKRVGPPPTFEQVEALSRGELPEPEAERVRETLSYYPDLLRVLTEPFPSVADAVLTDQEIEADLARIRERARQRNRPSPRFF